MSLAPLAESQPKLAIDASDLASAARARPRLIRFADRGAVAQDAPQVIEHIAPVVAARFGKVGAQRKKPCPAQRHVIVPVNGGRAHVLARELPLEEVAGKLVYVRYVVQPFSAQHR